VEHRTKQEVITGGAKSDSSSNPFKKGESVTIGYHPKYPHEFYIKGYDLKLVSRLARLFFSEDLQNEKKCAKIFPI